MVTMTSDRYRLVPYLQRELASELGPAYDTAAGTWLCRSFIDWQHKQTLSWLADTGLRQQWILFRRNPLGTYT